MSDLIVYLGSIDFVCQMWTANYARESTTTNRGFELSAAEREAIEHEMHHYEDPVRRPLKR